MNYRQFILPTIAVGAAGVVAYAFRRSKTEVIEPFRKGVFVEYNLFSDPAEELRKAGLDFIILQTGVQKKTKDDFIWRDSDAVNEVDKRINPPGSKPIRLWLWGWPIPTRYKEYVPHVEDVLNNTNAAGYILNIEARAWSEKKFGPLEAVADDFIDRLRNVTNKPLFISSHGRADYAPLPWKALSRLDGGMPQTYDATNQYGPKFITKCIQSYRGKGFQRIWPTLGATKTDVPRMKEQLVDLPCVEAVTWWTWTTIGRNDERKQVTKGAVPCQTVVV